MSERRFQASPRHALRMMAPRISTESHCMHVVQVLRRDFADATSRATYLDRPVLVDPATTPPCKAPVHQRQSTLQAARLPHTRRMSPCAKCPADESNRYGVPARAASCRAVYRSVPDIPAGSRAAAMTRPRQPREVVCTTANGKGCHAGTQISGILARWLIGYDSMRRFGGTGQTVFHMTGKTS